MRSIHIRPCPVLDSTMAKSATRVLREDGQYAYFAVPLEICLSVYIYIYIGWKGGSVSNLPKSKACDPWKLSNLFNQYEYL